MSQLFFNNLRKSTMTPRRARSPPYSRRRSWPVATATSWPCRLHYTATAKPKASTCPCLCAYARASSTTCSRGHSITRSRSVCSISVRQSSRVATWPTLSSPTHARRTCRSWASPSAIAMRHLARKNSSNSRSFSPWTTSQTIPYLSRSRSTLSTCLPYKEINLRFFKHLSEKLHRTYIYKW